jgi:hypothetical protein
VKAGKNLVGVTNGAYKQVKEGSEKVVELVAEISAASQEQSQGIEQVNKAVVEMNEVTQRNAASAEELASIMALFKTNHQGDFTHKNRNPSHRIPRKIAALPDKTSKLSIGPGTIRRKLGFAGGAEEF